MKAETEFREAFERLKKGAPKIVGKGTPVSQNNVAREAGCDPSALRKSRYPLLVSEIQQWISNHAQTEQIVSQRQTLLRQRKRNRSLKEQLSDMKATRDHALSLLVEADAKIVELIMEIERLRVLQPKDNVTSLHSRPSVY